MSLFKRKKVDIKIQKTNKPAKLNVKDKNLDKLKMVLIFVNRGHGIAMNNLILESGLAMSVMFFAEGTKEKYVMDILGGEEKNKEGILTIVNERDYKQLRKNIINRFLYSYAANGVAITVDIDSLAGVLAYKYLSDYGGVVKHGKK